jgi:hypothetical protein
MGTAPSDDQSSREIADIRGSDTDVAIHAQLSDQKSSVSSSRPATSTYFQKEEPLKTII